MTVPLGLAFALYLQAFLRPGMFAWDMAAVFLLLVPAGTRAVPARRRVSLRLDWYRRLRFDPAAPAPFGTVLLNLPVLLFPLVALAQNSVFTRLGLGGRADRLLVAGALLASASLRAWHGGGSSSAAGSSPGSGRPP